MSERTPPPHNERTETPLGDTPEAHDEISPLDLPPDHPARKEAERQSGGIEGETPGNSRRTEGSDP